VIKSANLITKQYATLKFFSDDWKQRGDRYRKKAKGKRRGHIL